jgi:hypothetical protein
MFLVTVNENDLDFSDHSPLSSGGITAGQFGAMPHLKLKNFHPIFSRRLKNIF